MIRLALATLAVVAAASPALAYSTQSMPAPHDSSRMHFGIDAVEHLAPSGVSSNDIRVAARPTDAKRVVYEIPAAKPAARQLNVSDPKDNPFMAR
jgi:hypothetical protein